MSRLSVRTKNDTSPQGKPRVYFSCHPADFEEYFETICTDFFATQDCAIYYESDWDNAAAEGDLKSQLSDMQLFVVPITTKFLSENCRAKAMEYGFAMEKHIPVLPIAMEGGLDKLFSEMMNKVKEGFGDVQYLDRTSTDTTEIPYAEKLKNRLEAVLIGNELAERVRAAFDAYIFLSYRKKDREKAKELMNLIHRIPYCRDIAIWYDEFLIPGEAWNRAIADALKKSKLVTLMVTPSVIEPGNFIIEHEYPDAIAAGKEVLPAEVVPTEREVLFSLYEGISMPFDGRDEAVLAEKLKSIAVTENDNSPEHNYLIGLAYLGAIDVERNPERAVELITSAAEAGLPEAMEKLADMYNSGEGVERNYYTAAEWMEKCCEALAAIDSISDKYVTALDKSGKMWMDIYQMRKAKQQYNKLAYACYERNLRCLVSDRAFRLQSSYCDSRLGEICMAEGLIDEALEHFEMSLQVDRISADETIESRSCLASSLKNIGSLYQTKERISEAEACFIECCEILKSLADETGSVETQENLWAGYCSLAGIYEHEYRYTEAFEYYSKGLAILKRLVEETETVSSKYELSSCYVLIGSLHRIMGNRDEALSCYLEGIKLARDVVEKTNSIKSRRILAADYMEIGQLYKDSQYEDAIKYYEMSLEIIKAVSEATDCNDIKRDLILCYYSLGGVYESEGLIEEAEKLYKLAMEVPYVAPRKIVKKTVDLGNGVRIHIHTPAEEGS